MRNIIEEILHLGVVKTKTSTRKLLFWPGMTEEIETYISNCSVCQKCVRLIPKEPLINHEFPDLPFEKVAVNIYEFQKISYLILGEYYSKWIDIKKKF